MMSPANLLVVSDLHFGEELLPGASAERRRAIELGAAAFREFLRYHAVRRRDGRPWRLVIAGDLFDFMSVVISGTRERPAKSADERRFGLGRGVQPGVERMRRICESHRGLLGELVRFAAAGHTIDILVGNHDIELLSRDVVDELMRQLAVAGGDRRRPSEAGDGARGANGTVGGSGELPRGQDTPAPSEGSGDRDGFASGAGDLPRGIDRRTPSEAGDGARGADGTAGGSGEIRRGIDPGLDRALARIRVLPWFIYLPGVCWIEHGHVYDEGCSFEFNLAPMDPKDGWLIHNVDYAAVRYLGATVPEVDPHGIEEWGLWGYLRYTVGLGPRAGLRLWLAYGRFVRALFAARRLHRSFKRRDRRRREHRTRLAEAAVAGGISLDTAAAIDRLARTPLTVSGRRLGRMVMLDRFGIGLGSTVAIAALLVLLPVAWALTGAAAVVLAAMALLRWLGEHMVTSQLPMRAVPQRLRKLVDAPVVVFGHTHDPRWQKLRSGGLYVNTGTWLPATRPGLRRSFTFLLIQPSASPGPPNVELRQWREGVAQPFDAGANIGAGVSMEMPRGADHG